MQAGELSGELSGAPGGEPSPGTRAQPTRAVVESILAELAQGRDVDAACRRAGISVRVFHRWCPALSRDSAGRPRERACPAHAATRRVDRAASPQGLPP